MNTKKCFVAICVLSFLLLPVTVTPAQTPSFQGLGDLPGGNFISFASGVSADGSVVVGKSQSDVGGSFRWTEADGMVGVGDFNAEDISADGSVIVGFYIFAGEHTAVRWTEDEGLTHIDSSPEGGVPAASYAVSADGSTVVGYSKYSPCGDILGGNFSFRWSEAQGTASLCALLDPPPTPHGTNNEIYAEGVSADGSVVVGKIWNPPQGQVVTAFRWSETEGLVTLGDVPEATSGLAVSGDGSTVVGAWDGPGQHAMRWTEAEGMVDLGMLPIQGYVRGIDVISVSADGSVVVGGAQSRDFDESFIWDEAHGMRNLQDVLTNDYGLGAELGGWTLESASDISDDGTTIVGRGINPDGNWEAFRAVIPQLSLPILTTNGSGNWDAPIWDEAAHLPSPEWKVAIEDDGVTVGGNAHAYYVDISGPNGQLMVDAGGNLDVATKIVADGGTLDVRGTVSVGTGLWTDGDLHVRGTINTGTRVTVNGDLNLQGTIAAGTSVAVNGDLYLASTGTLNVGERLTIGRDFVLEIGETGPGSVTAQGEIVIESDAMLVIELDPASPFKAGAYPLIATEQADGITGTFLWLENRLGDYVGRESFSYTDRDLTLTLDKDLNLGDANLDTKTDVRDFNQWNAHKFTSNTDWTTGDFNGDGITDVRDFNVWNAHKFTSAGDPAPLAEGQVPEPGTLLLLTLTGACLILFRAKTSLTPAP